jgi:hypothetical protein
MRINYLLGFPTFLMVIGLAWASQSHADWGHAWNELEDDDLPEVESLLENNPPRSSFDIGPAGKPQAAADHSVLELVRQFDAMQQEVQELRGRLETQDHELKLLKKQQSQPVANVAQKVAPENSSLNSNSGFELNTSGITYKPAGT